MVYLLYYRPLCSFWPKAQALEPMKPKLAIKVIPMLSSAVNIVNSTVIFVLWKLCFLFAVEEQKAYHLLIQIQPKLRYFVD